MKNNVIPLDRAGLLRLLYTEECLFDGFVVDQHELYQLIWQNAFSFVLVAEANEHVKCPWNIVPLKGRQINTAIEFLTGYHLAGSPIEGRNSER